MIELVRHGLPRFGLPDPHQDLNCMKKGNVERHSNQSSANDSMITAVKQRTIMNHSSHLHAAFKDKDDTRSR